MKKLIVLVTLSFLFACNKPEDAAPIVVKDKGVKVESYQILVANEGNFGNGVASISKVEWIADSTLRVEQNAYYSKNNEYIGNVLQSIYKVGDELWLIVNNSQKIIRCDKDLKKIGELTGFNSPRYMAQNEGFVFVSDLYENAISVIDKSSLKTVKKIQTDSWNEELLFVNGQLWITQTSKSEVLIMDVSTFQFVDTIYTTREPFAIKKDLNNKVWILCNGGLMEGKTPYLYQIDVNSKAKIDSVNLSSLASIPSKLEVYENEIYVLAKNVYQLNNGSMNQLISGSGKTFYSLAVNKDYIFATDAKDYVRNGVLYRYDKKKLDHVQSTETGIIPGFIYFGE